MKLGRGIIWTQNFEALLLSYYKIVKADLYPMIIYLTNLGKICGIERVKASSTNERSYFHVQMVQGVTKASSKTYDRSDWKSTVLESTAIRIFRVLHLITFLQDLETQNSKLWSWSYYKIYFKCSFFILVWL